uniref:Uncharacterized protein n=1 Tax=viral metagenome TaxID=1070528 RepID=A0A6M3IHR3_9ZZZZ
MDLTGWVWTNGWPFKGRGHLAGASVPEDILKKHMPQLIAEGRIEKASKYVVRQAKEEVEKGGK